MATNLDMDKAIVEPTRKPTAYMEDIIFQLVQSLNFPILDVGTISGTVTADLSLSNQFGMILSSSVTLDIINVSNAMFRTSAIEFYNPGGAFDVTAVTVPAGYTALKAAGSTISTTGKEYVSLQIVVSGTDMVQLFPTELVPV